MSSKKPLLVVLGATGNQGGSVLAHFLSLSTSPYALRGVTRNVSSAKSVSLMSRGVEMVAADFDNPSSLDAAFQGASAIFSVTDFWGTFMDPVQREKAAQAGETIGPFNKAYEAQQNRNIIDAAAKVRTLEKFVFSSLPNCEKISGGKYAHVYHFDGKAIAEEYGRLTYPELWEKTSVFYAGLYLENYFSPYGALFTPVLNKSKDTLTLQLAEPLATAKLPLYSVVGDTGALVHAILDTVSVKKLVGVNEWLSYRDFAKLLAEVLGKKIEFVNHSPNLETGDPDLDRDFADSMPFWIEYRYDGGNVDKTVMMPGELGVAVQLEPVREWIKKQDWDTVLRVQ